jgi:hypothetical protein
MPVRIVKIKVRRTQMPIEKGYVKLKLIRRRRA